jgi:hypothetical protein
MDDICKDDKYSTFKNWKNVLGSMVNPKWILQLRWKSGIDSVVNLT